MNAVDTGGWLEYLGNGPNAESFADPIEDTRNLVVPIVCIYEVFKNCTLEADEEQARKAVALMKKGLVVPLTEELAIEGALLSLRHNLPMPYSLVYACAQSQDAILWTRDARFRKLPGVKYLAARRRRK